MEADQRGSQPASCGFGAPKPIRRRARGSQQPAVAALKPTRGESRILCRSTCAL